MKYIKKSFPPKKLQDWFNDLQRNENGCLINCRYRDLTSEVHKNLVKILLEEQGFLCCYTGLRIDDQTSHIEHLKPQTISKKNPQDHDDVNYYNMLAAYPKEENIPRTETKTKRCKFGAIVRGDKELAVNPLSPECERKFIFELEGKIKSANAEENDKEDDANRTIGTLNLNDESLVELRKTAIDEFFYSDDCLITPSKIEKIINQGICTKDGKGRYPKFCFVIEKVAPLMLNLAEREKKRKQDRIKRIKSQANE